MTAATAQQLDGFPDVVLREAPGSINIVAKVPNGQPVTIIQRHGMPPDEQLMVQWNAVQGWAKATNIRVAESAPMAGGAQKPNTDPVDQTAAFVQQADGHPDVVLKDTTGAIVAKVPNLQPVQWLQQNGDIVQVLWKDVQGWAKVTNVKRGTPAAQPAPGPSPAAAAAGGGFAAPVPGGLAPLQMLPAGVAPAAAAPGGVGVAIHGAVAAAPAGLAPGPVGEVKLFTCNHHTDTIVGQYPAFVGCPWPLPAGCLKASMPPFNGRDMTAVPGLISYDLPVYGPDMTKAVMDIFTCADIKDRMADCAREKSIPIPQFTINKVVMSKMAKVREMIAKIETEKGAAGTNELDVVNLKALTKLKRFVDRIDTLHLSNISDANEWKQWLDNFFDTPTWKDNLHVDIVLNNFGFSPALASSIGQMTIGRGEKVTAYSIRWLAKAFEAFGLAGTIADVVNLVYAMTNQPATDPGKKPERSAVLHVLAQFRDKLADDAVGDLWIPTHLVHDSETDDMLSWLLLEYVHSLRETQLRVLIQMPADPELNHAVQNLQQRPTVQVYVDPKSRNAEPVKAYWQRQGGSADTVYIVSRMEARGFAGQFKKSGPYEYTEVLAKDLKVGEKPKILWRDAQGFWQVSLGGRAGVSAGCSQLKALSRGEEHPSQIPAYVEAEPGAHRWQLMSRAENNILCLVEEWVPLTIGQCANQPKQDVPLTITADPPRCACQALAATDGLCHCTDHTRKVKFDKAPPPVRRECPHYAAALTFLDKLQVEHHLDHFHDRCFCADCYPGNLPDHIEGYIVPRGWVGFGLTIPNRLRNQVFNGGWPTTFHGTKYDRVTSILGHSHPGMPGDRLVDGSILESDSCAGRQDAGFYTSPTIRYAGLQLYASAAEFQYGSKHWGQVVLQCKQAPLQQTADCSKKQETMGFLLPDGMYGNPPAFQKYWSKLGHPDDPETKAAPKNFVCPYTPLNELGIEWFSNKPVECIPYRLCVRVFPDGAPPDIKSSHHSAFHQGKKYETFRSPVDGPPNADRKNGQMWL